MNIAVAGAGHGGLVAAARLAEKGYSVSVYEKREREQLGHDWEDRFTFDILSEEVGINSFPDGIWRYRGDCAFVSPDYKSKVIINYTDENRQKIMWRKPIIDMLIKNAEKCRVKFFFGDEVLSPIIKDNGVKGIKTLSGNHEADLVIDAAGVFSPVRKNLPEKFGIEKSPKRGDIFYAYRAYFDKRESSENVGIPFEVYLYHAGEQGLSWCCTNDDSVDILIGRIDPLREEDLNRHIDNFKKAHPWTGDKIIHGGNYGIIPVRRPLALMTANGYAAVGDSAFMTTPMNGMGIDLSLLAGRLLAETVIKSGSASAEALWQYNRKFHLLYGGDTAKNESLKNALLNLPGEGVDFLFENGVIEASDLSGAGKNTDLGSLLGKFVRGMKNPPYFFKILGGIMNGAKLSKAFKKAPQKYSKAGIFAWQREVQSAVLKVTRK